MYHIYRTSNRVAYNRHAITLEECSLILPNIVVVKRNRHTEPINLVEVKKEKVTIENYKFELWVVITEERISYKVPQLFLS